MRSIAFIREFSHVLMLEAEADVMDSEMLVANYFPKMMGKAASMMRPALPAPEREEQRSLLD